MKTKAIKTNTNSCNQLNTVSVVGREEGYTVKYGLSPRDFPKAQPEENPKGSGNILPYILT